MLSTDNCTPLCPIFNAAMVRLAHEAMPDGYNVEVGAPATLNDLVKRYYREGRITVELTGSGGCTMGIPEQHYAFRAWHDMCHVAECGPFTVPGEIHLARLHHAAIYARYGFNAWTQWFCALIEIEIVSQNEINEAKGHYPCDPRAFALCKLAEWGITRPEHVPLPASIAEVLDHERIAA